MKKYLRNMTSQLNPAVHSSAKMRKKELGNILFRECNSGNLSRFKVGAVGLLTVAYNWLPLPQFLLLL